MVRPLISPVGAVALLLYLPARATSENFKDAGELGNLGGEDGHINERVKGSVADPNDGAPASNGRGR